MRISPPAFAEASAGKKFIVFLIVLVNMMGYGILFPILPLYQEKLGAGAFAIAGVMGMFAVAQFFAGPILGILSDRQGRRPWMLFSLIGTFISFLMFAYAEDIWVLFFARLIDGISGGNIPIAQAYMADITPKEKRAEGMGVISGAMSLGFVIGPVVGGVLGQYGIEAPSLFGAFLALVNIILAFFFLKETEKEEVRARALKLLPFKEIVAALKIKEVGILLVVYFFQQLTWALHFPIFSLFLEKSLGIGTMMGGFLLAYRGAISSVVQLFLVGRVLGYFRLRQGFGGHVSILKITIAMMVIGLMITGAAPNIMILLIGLTVMELGGDFIGPVIMGEVSKRTPAYEQGEMMGVTASLSALGRTAGPYFGGASFEILGASSPFYWGAILMGVGLLILR